MEAAEYIQALEKQIVETEKILERLRIKVEVAREVTTEIDNGQEIPPVPPPVPAPSPAADPNRKYRGLLASDAILAFLTDHGRTHRKIVVASLERQIKTDSKKPREIIRTCIGQLAKRERVEVDTTGYVTIRAHE